MQIYKYTEHEDLEAAIQKGDLMIAVISFDRNQAYMATLTNAWNTIFCLQRPGCQAPISISGSYLTMTGRTGRLYVLRIIKNITDRTRRVAVFYKDGFTAISAFMAELGLLLDIRMPKRYRHHMDALRED